MNCLFSFPVCSPVHIWFHHSVSCYISFLHYVLTTDSCNVTMPSWATKNGSHSLMWCRCWPVKSCLYMTPYSTNAKGIHTYNHLENTEMGESIDKNAIIKGSVHFSSIAQSCLIPCNPMNRSTPGLPLHHQLPEFTQTHVHRVSDAIQPSHPLLSPSPPASNPSQHQGLFQWVNSSHEVAKVLEFQL